MSIRTYCDICQNQIQPNEMTGSFVFLERDWASAVKKGKDQSVVRKEWIFCEPCVNKIKTSIAEIENSIKTKTAQ